MTQIPKKLDAHSPHYQMINTINQLIDHLKDYEKSKEENDDNLYAKLVEVSGNLHTMYKELGNRIQEISNLQLEMSRDFKARLLELGKEI